MSSVYQADALKVHIGNCNKTVNSRVLADVKEYHAIMTYHNIKTNINSKTLAIGEGRDASCISHLYDGEIWKNTVSSLGMSHSSFSLRNISRKAGGNN